ncbi:hypothetical protein ACFQ3Z_39365 [Streptomyces nogalater]
MTPPKKWAAGVPAVVHALEYSLEQTSPRKTGIDLLTMNQVGGIDCPGCAWADPPGAPSQRVLRERRQAHQRRGHDAPDHRRLLPRAQRVRSGRPFRHVAQPAGRSPSR